MSIDKKAILERRRRLAAAAAMSTVTLASATARPQICLSPAREYVPPCASMHGELKPEDHLRTAKCHVEEKEIAKALEHYELFLATTEGVSEHADERRRVTWQMARLKLIDDALKRPVSHKPLPEPEPPAEQPEGEPAPGVEVMATPPPESPEAAGAACGCDVAPAPSRDGAWWLLLGAVAWLRRRLPSLLVLLAACTPPPAALNPEQDPPEPPPTEEPTPEPEPIKRDGLDYPVVLRCSPNRNTACNNVFRVRRKDGVADSLVSWVPRDSPLLVDDQAVYWAGGGVRKDSQKPLELDFRTTRLRGMAQHGDMIAVVDDAGVYLLPKDGSPRRDIDKTADAWSVTLADNQLAWTLDRAGQSQANVVVADHQGKQRRVIRGESSPQSVRIAGDGIFWLNFRSRRPGAGDGAVRASRGGGPPVTIAEHQRFPRDLTLAGEHLYWVTDQEEGRIVRRVPVVGGDVERISESHEIQGHRGNRDRIEVHDGLVYWNAGHSVVRTPVGGGRAQIVITADVDGDVVNFAVDDLYVYVAVSIYQKRSRR